MMICQHLDYADIMHDKRANLNFEAKLCLEITGAILQTIRDSIYKEIALKSLG